MNQYNDFINSCQIGDIVKAKHIISKKDANIKWDLNDAFRLSCQKGRKEVAEWLYNLSLTDNNTKINIRAESDDVFISCSKYKNISLAIWLASICPNYELVIKEDKIISYKILSLKDKIKDKTADEIIKILKIKTEPKPENTKDDQCYICLDEPNLKYGCNHLICLNCMIQWNINEDHQSCDLCKKPIEYNLMTLFI